LIAKYVNTTYFAFSWSSQFVFGSVLFQLIPVVFKFPVNLLVFQHTRADKKVLGPT